MSIRPSAITRTFPAAKPICIYCGRPATTVDHILPRSRGGTDDPDNVVPACKACNSAKSNRTPQEWRAGISRTQAVALASDPELANDDDLPPPGWAL
jgi:5-methylcytosine-specific restriction endonuclease McrA